MTETAQFEFDQSFQTKVAALVMRDTNFAMNTKDLIKPEYFTEDAAGALVRIVHEHVKTYRSVPDMKILPTILKDEIAAKRIRSDMVDPIKKMVRDVLTTDLSNPQFVQDKVTDFAKHQAVEGAIMQILPLLEKGKDWGKIGQLMKDAVSIGSTTDGGDYDFFNEIGNRTKQRHDLKAGKVIRNGITTGYPAIDAYLYHLGWGRKELSCMMGAAKAGKSMSLGDFGKNAAMAGFNVLYDSLEVSKEIIAERIDAAMSDTLMRELHKDPDAVEAAIKAIAAKSGHFKLRDHASGTLKPSALHRVIENYRAEGIIFDLVIVDYADIMAAEYRSDNLIENLRTIYIDLRALAHELNCAFLTATQTNRDGAKAATAKATDVGDDWNKARTVDIMIGINATDAEKAAGEARLTWLLSRNTEDGFSLRIKQDRAKMQFLKKVIGKE
ncbi:DnaB-like helicase C-terminal domain-containing protein [Rhizobium laguerreae]|uniref:DnaB-like helicase C-terminal domain-containing protein n=1 Tax=Rhizobium laguerreae TaxID=1076926 RepID=UPI001C92821C|nr:DnaB-like helicase C-terminal domain-containing protein [Rhizobium laguerreae]MBY3231897.1 AAA family ATPase [Rhizobium laguerreae]